VADSPAAIGVFGGTFDPPHWGHLFIAQYAAEALNFERVIWLPSYISPFKQAEKRATGSRHRLAMLQLALADNPLFQIDDFEIQERGISYTAISLDYLRQRFPAASLHLLIGEDNAASFHAWQAPEQILKAANVVVYGRRRERLEANKINRQYLSQMQFIEAPLIEISSSLVRERLLAGKSVRYFIPAAVAAYISRNELYSAALTASK
jgi:nicotinate-nucleotide adenylyltransferase